MTILAQQTELFWSSAAVALAFCGFAAVGTMILTRMLQRRPVVRYQPRRGVPWHGIDLLIVLAVFLVGAMVAQLAIEAMLGRDLTRPPGMYDVEKANAAHMIARLLSTGGFWTIAACVVSAAVVAPIVEEFLFRVLLQGWLEAAERRLRRKMPTLRRWLPVGAGPILLTSLLFGRMHFRVDTPMNHPTFQLAMMIGSSLVGLLVMLFAVVLLRGRVGATAADLGWVPEKFFADVRLGLLAFAGLAAPIYGLQILLSTLLPKYLAPDPAVLFIFALALGTLYCRTHRAAPSIVLHMALNATSLTLALLTMRIVK